MNFNPSNARIDWNQASRYLPFRINSTHIFMVGGLSNSYKLEDGFEDVSEDEDKCPTNYTGPIRTDVADNILGGGKFFREAWVYDGYRWSQTKPMLSVRDNPSCGLVEMNDGEVLNIGIV